MGHFKSSRILFFLFGGITIWISFPYCILAQTQTVGYAESCKDDGRDCDSSKHLICLNGICKCSNPETMIYDETIGTCAVTRGYSCHQEEVYTKALRYNTQVVLTSTTLKFKRKLPCAYGGICRIKVCEDLMSPLTDYEAIYKLSHMHCDYTGNRNCPLDSGLNCINGYCECSLGAQQYFNGQKCVSLVNGTCNTASDASGVLSKIPHDCTPNAECVKSGVQSTCQCVAGFVLGDDGHCMPDYQQPCDNKNLFCRADGRLACVNGKCQCETELHVYDTELSVCRGLVGSSCVIPTGKYADTTGCTTNAYCDGSNVAYPGICKCEDDTVETANRTCISK